MNVITKDTATKVRVYITANDHITGLVGATLTVHLAKHNDVAFALITPSAVTDVGFGWYDIGLTSAHTDTVGNLALHIIPNLSGDIVDVIYTVSDYSETSKAVWDVQSTSHVGAGTTGLMLSQISANTAAISISQSTLTSLINTVLKYERNRTRIDTTTATLTIYDDDCTTPLTVFNLKDHLGNPSVAEVCERSPVGCP